MASSADRPENLALPLGCTYLIGVSGGCDSVTLLHLLREAGHRDLVVCHLDHGLRGRESDEDRRLVEELAGRCGYDFEVGQVDVADLARRSGQSIEQAARGARHRFFARIAAARGIFDVVLAHHADDQAETILLNLLRGSGLRGLVGMEERKEMLVDGVPLVLRRPLLAMRRAMLRDIAEARGIRFREDSSNARRDCFRNRVRLDLLPLAREAAGRDVVGAIVRLGQSARRDVDLLDELTDAALAEARRGEAGQELSVCALRAQHPSLRVRVLAAWLAARGIPGLSGAVLARVEALLPAGADVARENLPGGRWVRRRGGRLFIQAP